MPNVVRVNTTFEPLDDDPESIDLAITLTARYWNLDPREDLEGLERVVVTSKDVANKQQAIQTHDSIMRWHFTSERRFSTVLQGLWKSYKAYKVLKKLRYQRYQRYVLLVITNKELPNDTLANIMKYL